MAWGSGSRASENFDAQFEPEGESFTYRRSMKDAPIRVTAEEHSRFSNQYRTSFRRLTWGFAAGVIALLAAILVPAIIAGTEPGQWVTYVAVIGAMIPLLWLHHRVWNAPARELRGRAVVGRQRSRGEVRRAMLARMSWGQLAGAFVILPFMLLKISAGFDIRHGWGRLWLVFAGVTLLLLLFQLIRKWQISAGGD